MEKQDQQFYKPKNKPEIIQIPMMTFIELDGAGRPDAPEFAEKLGALYSLAYTVRMAPRSGLALPEYQPFTVYPLEGVWDFSEAGRQQAVPGSFGVADKAQLVYRLMIRQPDFVDEAAWPAIVDFARRKKPGPLLEQVRLTRLEEGLCVQMTHVGSYDDEPASFELMAAFCRANGLRRREHTHREIYMTDPRRTAPAAAKTVLRWTVAAGQP
jgi:hypothetical protein